MNKELIWGTVFMTNGTKKTGLLAVPEENEKEVLLYTGDHHQGLIEFPGTFQNLPLETIAGLDVFLK